MREPNLSWMTFLRQLIAEEGIHHTFWCFNANSGDTGGLVGHDFTTWDEEKYEFVKEVLWQEDGYFVGLDHAVPLGKAGNGIALSEATGMEVLPTSEPEVTQSITETTASNSSVGETIDLVATDANEDATIDSVNDQERNAVKDHNRLITVIIIISIVSVAVIGVTIYKRLKKD
jgi:hypothetical protein